MYPSKAQINMSGTEFDKSLYVYVYEYVYVLASYMSGKNIKVVINRIETFCNATGVRDY